MSFSPDGRLFICEQTGALRIIKDGKLLPDPFLKVNVDPGGERGLLGVTFDPEFAKNQYVYIYYTSTSTPRRNRVSRFTGNGDTAVAGSERILLELDGLSGATNHNGGAMHFGPDSKLYIAVGENSNSSNSQTLGNLLGKVLRINADGSIPSDNPFYQTASGANRAIWALGLRNPFTFAFQPGTGRMYINDVGENQWEEINLGVAGKNYGWPLTEGYTSDSRFQSPEYAYDHGNGCSIIGAAFYNPANSTFPAEYAGTYFFADYCAGWIRRMNPETKAITNFATNVNAPVDLAVSPGGDLYYLASGTGSVYRVAYTENQVPQISQHPADQTVTAGSTASFSVQAAGASPLRYQWSRNGSTINGATGASYTTPATVTTQSGDRFQVTVTNDYGSVTSNPAYLTVTSNRAPTGTIRLPAAGSTYTAGSTILYSGTATDPEDGELPASAFTWQVDFHHDTHVHPFLPATSGAKSGSFVVPTTGHTEANVWFRIYLKVKDAGGLVTTSYVDVTPQKSTVTLQTNPAGLQITLDGQPQTAPVQVLGVVGIARTLGVISPVTVNGASYEFVSWSDGQAPTHTISTPAANATYTATFRKLVSEEPRPVPGVVYVSDLVPAAVDNGWGWIEKDRSNGEQAGDDGRGLSLGGKSFVKGVGAHSNSQVRFVLDGACSAFGATIGIDDETGGRGTVVFEVWADGAKLYDSGLINGSTGSKAVNVDITGKKELSLVVTDGGDGIDWDHADWADAQLTCGSVALSDLTAAEATNGWGGVERDRSTGGAQDGDGEVLTLNGKTYTKGLGVHANSQLVYQIGGRCSAFTSDIGLDDETLKQGSVVFEVWTDGVKVFDSGRVTGDTLPKAVTVDLTGKNQLKLVVTDAGDDGHWDHADWAGARLTCSSYSF